MTNLTPATLSSRGRRNLTQIYARIRGAVRQREDMARDPHTRLIDLSTAENWLVRDELLDIMHDGVRQHMQAPQLSYPAGLAGDLDVLDALAAFVNDPRRSHFRPRTPVTSAHVATAPGASACLDAVLFNVCDEGDAVLLPAPYWSAFELLFRTRAHVTPLAVKTTRLGGCFGTEMLAALDAAVDASWTPVKALVLTNPHNPLGRCYPRWWLEACVRFCGRRGIHFVSDEIYAHSLFGCGVGSRRSVVDGAEEEGGDEGFVSALSLDLDALGVDKSLVHVVWSMSKDFGASGIRLVSTGCVGSHRDTVQSWLTQQGLYHLAVESSAHHWTRARKLHRNIESERRGDDRATHARTVTADCRIERQKAGKCICHTRDISAAA